MDGLAVIRPRPSLIAGGLFVLLLTVVAGPPAAQAADPSLSVVLPRGFQRGEQIELELRGARLGDAEQLVLYDQGIEAVELEAVEDGVVRAVLQVDPDCRLGIHALRLRTRSGLSNLQTFSVGALPEIQEEAESNSDFATPQPIPLDVTVNGIVENEDVDYFAFEARQGERVTVEVEGIRLGNAFFDPYVAILNEDRFQLASNDDTPLIGQDSLCSFIVPEDGRYIIQVRESAYGGSGSSYYRLHVGRFPRPQAVIPAGGRPGETLEVTWLSDEAEPWTSRVTIPESASGEHPLFAENEHGVAPSPNWIRVNELPNYFEQEPNDEPSQATGVEVPGAFNGVIERTGDVDFFRFSASEGEVFDIHVYARRTLRSPLDSVLSVHRPNGEVLAENDDTGGPDSYVRFTVPEDGEYLVSVRDHLYSGGPHFAYRVEVAPVAPTLSLSLPEKAQFVPTIMSVPRGNRGALLVAAARNDWGGPLQVELRDLPEGVSYETVPMAADRTDVPVLFEADDDAPLDGRLVDVLGRPEDESLGIDGRLQQRTALVRGRNNVDVLGHDADRMAVSVSEPAPFRIEIVQPGVPLVRHGSMELRVVATREEGFTAPIALRLLYDPPGVGSSGAVSIAEGESEAVIPLTANANAALRSWPIVVLGQATVGNGPVEVASQMAELEVADMFVNFSFTLATVEQGGEGEVVVGVESLRDFPGTARVELLGLPANTSTSEEHREIAHDATEVVFPVLAESNARPGRYGSLVCRVVLVENGEPITQTIGTGELRIDEPLPDAPPQPAEAEPAPEEAPEEAQEEPRRLTRLEQLRQERQRRLESP